MIGDNQQEVLNKVDVISYGDADRAVVIAVEVKDPKSDRN